MKLRTLMATLVLSQGILLGHATEEEHSVAHTSDMPKVVVDMKQLSEAFGNFIGRNLQNAGLDFDVDSLIQGIRNGVDGKPSPLSEEEYEKMMAALQQQAFEKTSSKNLTDGEAYLKQNSTKAGIVSLEDNKLQYEVLASGKGKTVESTHSPLINYTGTLIDGTVFGSSEENGGAITLPLSHTIEGFKKGITGMKEGEKRRLFIHPDLGYGTMSGHLPPNSLLIFDIEIVEADHQENLAAGTEMDEGEDESSDDDAIDEEDMNYDDDNEDLDDV